MKVGHLVIAASAVFAVPSLALAQTAPGATPAPSLVVGASVYDPQGGEVGKVESVTADTFVLDTGAHKATLAKSAVGSGAKGPTLAVTKAQIDQQIEAVEQKTATALTQALVPGADVRGMGGTPVGTVKEVSEEQVVIERPTGLVGIPRKAVGLGPDGLFISLTAAELDAALKPVSTAQ